LPKYLTKIFFGTLVFLVLAAIGTILLNSFLYVAKKQIEQEDWHNASHQVLINDIFYVFPNRIVLKDVVVIAKSTAGSAQPQTIFQSTKLILNFSLWEALAKRHLLIRNVAFGEVHLQYRACLEFFQKNMKEIWRILSQLPLNDIKFQAKSIFMNLTFNPRRPESLTMDFRLVLKGKDVTAQGSMGRKDEPNARLRFQFHGKIQRPGLSFDSLVLDRYDFYSKLWGSFDSGNLQFNGFSLLDTTATADGSAVKPKKGRLRTIISRIKGTPPAAPHLDPNIYILDVGFRAKVAFPKTDIDAFIFSFNTMPVNLKGSVSWENPVALNLEGSVLPNPSLVKTEAFEHADLNLAAVFSKDKINTNGFVKMIFQDLPKDNMPFTKIDVALTDNEVSIDPEARLKLHWKQSDLVYVVSQIEHHLQLQDSTVLFNLFSPIKLIAIQSPFYEGNLDGKVWIDQSQYPLKISGSAILKNVEANEMSVILDHFAKIHGTLSSQLYFTSDPDFALKGKLGIQNGTLNEFEFFKWLADNFALESVRNVPFQAASADFVVDAKKSGIYDINLDSKDVKAQGFFAVERSKLVSSKLSVSFSRDLLETSPKFRPILQRFPQENAFGFDFQLSGRQEAMNFQWLDSELKQKIQAWIPNFIERHIERNIDKSLEQSQPQETTPANEQSQ
jgi:hypothetical protein